MKPPSGTPSNYLGDCGFSNCMRPLSINLIFVFLGTVLYYFIYNNIFKKKKIPSNIFVFHINIVRLIVGNLTTLLLPYLSYQYRLFHGYIQGHSPHIDYQPAVEFLLGIVFYFILFYFTILVYNFILHIPYYLMIRPCS